MSNARSYSGTLTDSDHRIVATTTNIKSPYTSRKQSSKQVKFNLHLLANNKEEREKYQAELDKKIANSSESTTAFERWVAIRMSIISASKETVGVKKKKRSTLECPIIEQLSTQQHKLRVQIDNTADTQMKAELKTRRNKLLDQIRAQTNTNEINEIERRTAEVNETKDGAAMFKAVKELTSDKKRALVIKNDADEIVAQPKEAAEIVAKHFYSLFFNPSFSSISILSNSSSNKSRNSPITTTEVSTATSKLRNGRAVGPDGLPG